MKLANIMHDEDLYPTLTPALSAIELALPAVFYSFDRSYRISVD